MSPSFTWPLIWSHVVSFIFLVMAYGWFAVIWAPLWTRGYPVRRTQFHISDFLALLMPLAVFNGLLVAMKRYDSDVLAYQILVNIAVVGMWWYGGVRLVSRLGLTGAWRRIAFLGIVVPGLLALIMAWIHFVLILARFWIEQTGVLIPIRFQNLMGGDPDNQVLAAHLISAVLTVLLLICRMLAQRSIIRPVISPLGEDEQASGLTRSTVKIDLLILALLNGVFLGAAFGSGQHRPFDNSSKVQALIAAVSNGRTQEVLEKLTDHPEWVGARDRNPATRDWTLLHHAAAQGNGELTELLLKFSAGIDARSSDGQTALHVAAGRGRLNVVRILVEKGARVSAVGDKNFTALQAAATGRRSDVIKFLIERGAPVAERGAQGLTALHAAVLSNEPESVRLLLEAGAPANARDGEGQTPLHFAAARDFLQVAQMLLKAGADPTAKCKKGRTPLMLARKRGSSQVESLLKKVLAEAP